MFENRFKLDTWVGDEGMDALEVTDKEVEYLKQLRHISIRPRDIHGRKQNWQVPSEIIDGFLYHGTIEHARNMCLLDKLRIRHIINISDIRLRQSIANDYNVLWINIQDNTDVNIYEHFDRTNEFLQTCRSKNEKVLVNCRKGVSRSSSIILAYLIKWYHDTLHDAYVYLTERRYIACPNDAFFIQLIRYEKEVHRNKTMNADKCT